MTTSKPKLGVAAAYRAEIEAAHAALDSNDILGRGNDLPSRCHSARGRVDVLSARVRVLEAGILDANRDARASRDSAIADLREMRLERDALKAALDTATDRLAEQADAATEIAVLAAVCEMLAPETHADVTAKDYVQLARDAARAARGGT